MDRLWHRFQTEPEIAARVGIIGFALVVCGYLVADPVPSLDGIPSVRSLVAATLFGAGATGFFLSMITIFGAALEAREANDKKEEQK